MLSARKLLLACGLFGTVLAPSAPAAEPLSARHFTQLQALIKPCAGEDAWLQIPWTSGLWEARRRAAKEGKPILLWEMDGHPLGCT